MIHLGIDPGKSGGFGLIDASGRYIDSFKMPETPAEICELLEGVLAIDECRALVEKVASRPGQGVASTFKFGMSFGACVMAVTAFGVPFELYTPQKWQKVVGLHYPPKSTQTQRKALGRALAQRLFPGQKITNATADALLLAEACRREWK